MTIRVDLWKHQEALANDFVDGMSERGYHYAIAGCGVGKTLSTLAAIDIAGFKRVLIITTKAAMTSAWAGDISKFTDFTYTLLNKGTKKNNELLRNKSRIFIINYESAWRVSELGHFDLIVCDESHRIGSHNSKQSKAITGIGASYDNRLAFTGTAWNDRPLQIYGQARYLSPVKRPRVGYVSSHFGTWTEFFNTYAEYYMKDNIKIPTGYKNLSKLADMLNPFTTVIETEDVLDLPPLIEKTHNIVMDGTIRKHYREMNNDFITYIKDSAVTADNMLVQGLRLHQLTGGYVTDAVTGEVTQIIEPKKNPKIKATLDILDEIAGEPTVIFTRFTPDVHALKTVLESNGIGVSLLTGDVKEHDAWQADNGKQVLIANMQAGSEGVTLTRARHSIYYSVGFSRTQYEQSLYRTRRPGADLTKPIMIHRLSMLNSIDEHMWSVLAEKGDISRELLKLVKAA